MQCQCNSPIQVPATGSEQLIGQPTQSTGSSLQNTFYFYDPEKGTRYKLVNTIATVASCSAGGAIGIHLVTSQLRQLTGEGSLFQRAISLLDGLYPGSSLYAGIALGATLGAGGAVWLIHSAYQGGLRPRTVAAVRSVMNGLIRQVEGDYKTIQHCQETVQSRETELAIRKEEMLAEKERNRVKAQAIYDREVRVYENNTAKVTGELKGYLSGVFNWLEDPDRLPTYEEAISNTRRGGSYQLGQEVSNFFERKDFSESAQQRLLSSLTPYLNERELKNAGRILAKYHKYRPVFWPIVGPLERKYREIHWLRQEDQHKMGELESRVRALMARYSCFELDADGKVKTVPLADFSQYLPE